MSNPLRKSPDSAKTETTLHIQLFTLIPNPALLWLKSMRTKKMKKKKRKFFGIIMDFIWTGFWGFGVIDNY